MLENLKYIFDVMSIVQDYGYIAIATIVFFESGVFFLLPGDSLLFAGGLMSAEGSLNVFVLIFIVIFFSVLGNIVGYHIGKYFEILSEYKYFRKILHKDKIEKAKDYFEEHGEMAMIYAKFIPIIRTFVPIFAGFAEMNFKKYIKYSIISSVIWATVMVLAGYFLGQMFPSLIENLTTISITIIIFSLLPFAYKYIKLRRSKVK